MVVPFFEEIKVENILKCSLDSIPSPSPSVKIQILVEKVFLRCKCKTLLGIVNKLLKTKSLLTSPSNVLPYHLSEGEGDGMESRLSSLTFSTLQLYDDATEYKHMS